MQQLDAFLQRATQDGTAPGAVVCVAKRGQVVWHRAYGAAALTPQLRPMQLDTLFDLASLTKVVATTSLILVAHHEGCSALDTPLHHFYGPAVPPPLGGVTLRQLLAHTGGLLAWQPLYQQLLPDGPSMPSQLQQGTGGRRPSSSFCRSPGLRPWHPGSTVIWALCCWPILSNAVSATARHAVYERVARPLACMHWLPWAATALARCAPGLCRHGSLSLARTRAGWRSARRKRLGHGRRGRACRAVCHGRGALGFTHAMLESAAGRQDWLPPALLQ